MINAGPFTKTRVGLAGACLVALWLLFGWDLWPWGSSSLPVMANFPKDVLIQEADKILLNTNRISVQSYSVFYRKAHLPTGKGLELLLLHGKRFKSQTWLDLKTIHLMAAAGHSVTAVDLPGYGESGSDEVPVANRAEFLKDLIEKLGLASPVVVSPSLSGSFTIPLLRSNPDLFRGFVPVAPISTELLTPDEYRNIKIPTLVICGDKDIEIGTKSTHNLQNLPNSQVHILPNAGHPAYLDQPDMFHGLLYNFIASLAPSTQ